MGLLPWLRPLVAGFSVAIFFWKMIFTATPNPFLKKLLSAQICVLSSLVPLECFGYANLFASGSFHLRFFLKVYSVTLQKELLARQSERGYLHVNHTRCSANHVSFITAASSTTLNVPTNYLPHTSQGDAPGGISPLVPRREVNRLSLRVLQQICTRYPF